MNSLRVESQFPILGARVRGWYNSDISGCCKALTKHVVAVHATSLVFFGHLGHFITFSRQILDLGSLFIIAVCAPRVVLSSLAGVEHGRGRFPRLETELRGDITWVDVDLSHVI